jgi:predicted nucleotidyltransferase component of viral defense system
MTAEPYAAVIRAPSRDRLDLFLATANRLGAPINNIEKDFWVCWTIDALYHRLPTDQPRRLFKGCTSLSKAHGLIERFSEDIDVTVFRDELEQAATVEELEAHGSSHLYSHWRAIVHSLFERASSLVNISIIAK